MGRRPVPSLNALGPAMRQRRGATTGDEAAAELGLVPNTYYRLERGVHRPSADTALKLARWLGWSVEDVLLASRRPAAVTGTPDSPLDPKETAR